MSSFSAFSLLITSFRCRHLQLLTTFAAAMVVGAVMFAPSVDAEEVDSARVISATQERLEAVEARLALLEERLGISEDGEASDPSDVLRRLTVIEERLRALEAKDPLHLPGSSSKIEFASAEFEAPDASTIESRPEVEEEEAKRVFELQQLYLPSRGYAGGPLHYGSSERKIALHAFLDLEYIDAGRDGSRDGVSSFDNHHTNVFVRSELRPDLLAHIELEYEHSGEVVEIDQAYLAWAAFDHLTFRAGRFYAPFGIERFVWYSPTNALVSRPSVMRQIVPGNFYANGLVVEGAFQDSAQGRFTYELALTDGLGDDAARNRRGSRQARDNNSSRALTGRLAYAWPRLEVGTSYHQQRYADDLDLDLTFLGLDLAARFNGWELRSEWVDAAIDEAFFDTAGLLSSIDELDQQGWYVQLAYTFDWERDLFPQLRLVGRWDEIDLDGATTGNEDQRLWALGVNLSLFQHLRAKAEYQFASEDGPELEDDTFRFQLVIDY